MMNSGENLNESPESNATANLNVIVNRKLYPADQLMEKLTAIENASVKLERAFTVINFLTDHYSFRDRPDPKSAVEYLEREFEDKNSKEYIHAKQSASWCHDYKQVFDFMEIIEEYIFETRNILGESLNQYYKNTGRA